MEQFERSSSRRQRHSRLENAEDEYKFSITRQPAERIMIELGLARLMMAVERKRYDTLFFLDKSARPFAWAFKKAWAEAHPDQDPPQIKFINPPSDRYDGGGIFNTSIRENKYREEFLKIFPEPLGQKICLVDEQASTGRSFNFIKALLKAPSNRPAVQVDTFEAMSIWPSWYQKEDQSGVMENIPRPRNSAIPVDESRAELYRRTELLTNRPKTKAAANIKLRADITELAHRTARSYDVLNASLDNPFGEIEIDQWAATLKNQGISTRKIDLEDNEGYRLLEVPMSELRRGRLPHDATSLIQLFDLMERGHIKVFNDTPQEIASIEVGLLDFRDNPALNAVAGRIEASMQHGVT